MPQIYAISPLSLVIEQNSITITKDGWNVNMFYYFKQKANNDIADMNLKSFQPTSLFYQPHITIWM